MDQKPLHDLIDEFESISSSLEVLAGMNAIEMHENKSYGPIWEVADGLKKIADAITELAIVVNGKDFTNGH